MSTQDLRQAMSVAGNSAVIQQREQLRPPASPDDDTSRAADIDATLQRTSERLTMIGVQISGIGLDMIASPAPVVAAKAASPIWDIVRLADADRLEALATAGEIDLKTGMSLAGEALERASMHLEADILDARLASRDFENNARHLDIGLAQTRLLIEDLIHG